MLNNFSEVYKLYLFTTSIKKNRADDRMVMVVLCKRIGLLTERGSIPFLLKLKNNNFSILI